MSLALRIRDHIATQYLGGDAAELESSTPLLELNVIDSASIFDLVQFLSDAEGIDIPLEHVNAENFGTIGGMVELVERIKKEK